MMEYRWMDLNDNWSSCFSEFSGGNPAAWRNVCRVKFKKLQFRGWYIWLERAME